MKVNIISKTENPEFTVAYSAKNCYNDTPLKTDNHTTRIIRKCRNSGHLSVFEHASFTFRIEGVSRALSHQLVRHRLASYSQKSQRYVSENSFGYVTPESIRKNKDALASYIMIMNDTKYKYKMLINAGIPKEDARYILPNACTTQLIMTMNARELLHFFQLRCCNRAQWEIRELANKMLELCKKVAPVLFEEAGAPCEHGECPEAESCGKYLKKYEPLVQLFRDDPKLCASVKKALATSEKLEEIPCDNSTIYGKEVGN